MPNQNELEIFEKLEAAVHLLEENELALTENRIKLEMGEVILPFIEIKLDKSEDKESTFLLLDVLQNGYVQKGLLQNEMLRLRKNHKVFSENFKKYREQWEE